MKAHLRTGDDDSVDSQCTDQSVPNVFVAKISDHVGIGLDIYLHGFSFPSLLSSSMAHMKESALVQRSVHDRWVSFGKENLSILDTL